MSQRNVKVCSDCGETDRSRLNRGSRGLCRACYERVISSPCQVDGCNALGVGRYCNKHQYRLRKYGTPDPVWFTRLNYCNVDHCYRLNYSHGLCSYHAQKQRRHGKAEHERVTEITCSLCGGSATVHYTGVVPELCRLCSRRVDHIRRTYGLESHAYRQLLLSQDYRCSICLRLLELHGPPSTRPVVDHCHTTGQVRGLLCTTCNSGLGHLRDDVRLAQRAASYLEISSYHNPLDPAHLRMETAPATERNNHV